VTKVRLPGRARKHAAESAGAPPLRSDASPHSGEVIDLERRREQLSARVAELQFDLGGLVYEMATRNQIRVEVIVKRAAVLQDADAELGEIERLLRLEQTGAAGVCGSCGAPHSTAATYCWQCGQPLLQQVASHAINAPDQL
jgi:hypothetical protein